MWQMADNLSITIGSLIELLGLPEWQGCQGWHVF
jgi:hypothetical protein